MYRDFSAWNGATPQQIGLHVQWLQLEGSYQYLLKYQTFFGLISTTLDEEPLAKLHTSALNVTLQHQMHWQQWQLQLKAGQWLPLAFSQSSSKANQTANTPSSAITENWTYHLEGLRLSYQLSYHW